MVSLVFADFIENFLIFFNGFFRNCSSCIWDRHITNIWGLFHSMGQGDRSVTPENYKNLLEKASLIKSPYFIISTDLNVMQ